MPEEQQKVKILKKGKRKTPADYEREHTIALLNILIAREPEKARQILAKVEAQAV